MFEINKIYANNTNNTNNINIKKEKAKSPTFAGENSYAQKPTELSPVTPDYSVKLPIAYNKVNEIELPNNLKAHDYKLANGQRIVIVPTEGETVVKTYVNSGSMNETDNIRGISHYIEHNLFNGSKGLEDGQFFSEVNKMGASTNASTGFAETNYYIKSNLLDEKDFEKTLKLHASMLQSPTFAINKLEKEKGIVNSEINMILSDPENIAVNKTIKNLYQIQTNSQDLIGGTTKNITNLTQDDVKNYYKNNYYPSNMVTVITGEVDENEAITLVSKLFNAKNTQVPDRNYEKLTPITSPKREDIISDKATSTNIILGFNGPENNNSKDIILTDALSSILLSCSSPRVYKALKPLNTGTDIFIEKIGTKFDDNKAIIFALDCSDENSEKTLKAIYSEISKIQNTPPTDDEMTIIKKKMINSYYKSLESSMSLNHNIGTSFLEGKENEFSNYVNTINSMTAQDISDIAKKYLDLNKVAITMVHPDKVNPKDIKTNYEASKNVSFSGVPKDIINLDNVNAYEASNNFKIITNNTNNDNTYINFKLVTDDNAPYPPAISSILASMINEGSALHTQEELDFNHDKDGIQIGFFANEREIGSISETNNQDFDKALNYNKETIYNPRFTQENFETQRKDLLDRYNRMEKYASNKMDKEIYKGLPHGTTDEEMIEQLKNAKLEDVQNLYKYLLENGKGTITVSGAFDKKPELQQTLFNSVLALPNVEKSSLEKLKDVYQPTETTKVLTDTDNRNQAEILMAYKFKHNGNLKDNVSIDLLNSILGGSSSSRLFNDLRETQKLAYSVGSRVNFHENMGVMKLYIETTTENKDTNEISYDNIQKSIDGFKKNIEILKTKKISEDELNSVKLRFKNSLLNSTQTNDDKNFELSDCSSSIYGLDEIDKMYEMIDEITVDDIYNSANYIFKEKPTYSIVATENTIKHNEEYFKTLQA
ncbi:MAG: pitrilysin family protein [Candidatus Gastranaerophilales bacterium]